jgi:hypothetical protein
MVATPTRPAMKTRIMTPMPMSWMSVSGMKPKMSSDSVLCGPWPAYMKRAKKAARPTAMSVPMTGRVYIVRARPVRS